MSIIALAAAVAAAAGHQDAPRTTVQAVPMASLDIPDEIAPAVLPYLNCKLGSAGIELRAPGNGPALPPAAATGADCSRVRQQAADRALRILRDRRQGSADERREFVERTLTSIDSFLAIPANAPPKPEPTSAGQPNADDEDPQINAVSSGGSGG